MLPSRAALIGRLLFPRGEMIAHGMRTRNHWTSA